MIFRDRAVLITGATSGVGHALACAFATRGAHVIVHGRDPDRLAAVAAEVNGTPLRVDLMAPNGPARLANAVRRVRPDLSMLVNNAAVQSNYLFSNRSAAEAATDAAREVAVDLAAPIQLAALLLPTLQATAATSERPSIIINVTSGLALAPKKTAAVYCASKAGLRTFSKALRYQLDDDAEAGGPEVRVVEAMLPLVDTPMTAERRTRLAKLSPAQVATEIVAGLEQEKSEIRVGKARLFAHLHRWIPRRAERMLRDG